MKFPKLLQIWLIIAGIVIPVTGNAQPDTSYVLSQYLFKDFSKGVVQFRNGTVTSALMNYNTLSGRMVFEKSEKPIVSPIILTCQKVTELINQQ